MEPAFPSLPPNMTQARSVLGRMSDSEGVFSLVVAATFIPQLKLISNRGGTEAAYLPLSISISMEQFALKLLRSEFREPQGRPSQILVHGTLLVGNVAL